MLTASEITVAALLSTVAISALIGIAYEAIELVKHVVKQ